MNRLRCAPLLIAIAGCGAEEAPEPPAPAEGAGLVVVEPGKEDNFLSASAQEYSLTGTTTLTIEAEYADRPLEERMARARELVPFRQTVIGWFLNVYLVEKSHDATNASHGGFKSLTKNGSWEDLGLAEVDATTFELQFRQEVAGPFDLVELLPTTTGDDGKRYFELVMGRISTQEMQRLELNEEWYRKAPWKAFDPQTVDAERLEKLTLAVEAQPRSTDAWFDYARLVDDGVLDIGVHFGWDYHNEYHRVHSKTVYGSLVAGGFTSPVESYAAYRRDSGPLKKQMLTPIGPVEVRVSLFWGEPGTDADPDTDAGGRILEQDMRASLKARDVIVFSGHSGPFYGFALANWRKTSEGEVDDSELPTVEMPERYQVVLAEGCDTYAIGQGFFQNPAKSDRSNIDVVTTTSFSNAGTARTVQEFLAAFVKVDQQAPRLGELLADLDDNSSWFSTMYGVHGIDDNPRIHPWANAEAFGKDCSADADCGPAGNRCVDHDGARSCTFECTADDACGADALCQSAATDGWIRTRVCVGRPKPAADVRIARVVPNPDSDLNGDGVHDVRDDEAVTLVNAGDGPADLSGWALADNVGARFTFPSGYVLAGGGSVTVYGGGEAELTATRGLGLDNRGDTLRLFDVRGGEIDVVSWRTANPGDVVLGD